jgi:hypothetical protein
MNGPFSSQTYWEIWARSGGKIGAQPVETGLTLNAARHEAEYRARGNMISATERGPSKPIYELEGAKRLEDVIEDNCLLIVKRTVIRESSPVY